MSRSIALAVLVCFALVGETALRAQEATVPLRIIAINDLHGHLEPGENTIAVADPANPGRTAALRVGGVAHLATQLARLRAEQPNHVFVSSGDLIGASPIISGLFSDEPTIEVMNAMALDFNAAGNHEFDRGVAELHRIARGGCAAERDGVRQSCSRGTYPGARFPFLAANVVDRDAGQPILPPSFIKTVDGVRVGFIGAVTRSTPGIVVPSGVAGVRFLGEAAALNAVAAELRAAGVEAIVAVVHEGGDAGGGYNGCDDPRGAIFDIVRALDASIDIVLSGHTHRAYVCRIDGRPVIQGASFGRLVSVVDVVIDRSSGDIVAGLTRARNLPVPNGLDGDARLRASYAPLLPDPAVAAVVAHYRAAAAPLAERPVGRISAPFERFAGAGGDHPLGRLIADAQLAATRSNGAEIAFTNPGGIRTALHASRPDGTVTYADAYSTQPFGNSLVTMTLTGQDLKALLEQQWSAARPERARMLQPSAGFAYAWSARAAHGSRIAGMRLHGRAIRPDDTVRVTVNSYLAAGGDGFRVLREGRERVGGPLDVDALADFLRTRSASRPLAPSVEPRIERRD